MEAPCFEAKDLESVSGSYHTVCCIDVLIHYPPVRSCATLADSLEHLQEYATQLPSTSHCV